MVDANRFVFEIRCWRRWLVSVWSAVLLAVLTAASALAAGPPCCDTPARPEATAAGPVKANDQPGLRLTSIEPTVLFVRRDGRLLQVVEVTVENGATGMQASLEVSVNGAMRSTALGELKRGKPTFEVHVPDVREPTPVEFVLKAGGQVRDRRKMTWQPGRHWKVCMVPICHHDLGYTDTIENVLRRYETFYDDVLRFCEETDNWPEACKYRYTVEGAWSLQHYLENRPKQVVEKLANYVRAGRIQIPALFGNQISNLCGHEELIRLMYPSFRLKRLLGGSISTGSITDVPGLSWGLPTVLAGAGVKYFFAGLPTYFEWQRDRIPKVHTFWDESAILRRGRPDAFRWEGPDGASVLVLYQGGYGCWRPLPGPRSCDEVCKKLPPRLAEMERRGCPFSVARIGASGCGDNQRPSMTISRIARDWNSRWAYPQLIVATNHMFFELLEKECKDLRVFRGELPDTDYVVGTLSTAKETAINRQTHDRLVAAEKFATVTSMLADYAYPAEQIRRAYDDMLLYDEHTWGMAHQVGKLEDWSWADKARYAYRAAGLTACILSSVRRDAEFRPTGALNKLADSIRFDRPGHCLVVFNPLSFSRTDLVRAPKVWTGWGARQAFPPDKPFAIIDEQTGKEVPYQLVELASPRAPVPYAAGRYARGQFNGWELLELVFTAEDVPSLGWKTFRIVPRQNRPQAESSIVVGQNSLENRFFKVRLDPQTGGTQSVYDKELGRELVDQAARHKLNQFVARWIRSGKLEGPTNVTIRAGERGPVYGSLIVESRGPGCPQITQEVILYEKLKRIDLANRVLKDSTPLLELYFAFPFKVGGPQFRFEGSCSVIEPLRDQFPGSNANYYAVQHWADAGDGRMGVTLSPVDSHLLEFGGLWPCYVSQAHHGVTPRDFGRPFVQREQLAKGYMYSLALTSNFRTNFAATQHGEVLFRYSIRPRAGDWRAGDATRFGWSAANPLMAVATFGKQQGPLAKVASFCQIDQPNVLLLALKQAEDGNGIILRLIETEGKPVTAKVTLPLCGIAAASQTNLAEENQQSLPHAAHEFSVTLKPCGIATMRLEPTR